MSKVRLVKVIVQPVFVLDDGETLTEVPVETHTVLPADWPSYSSVRFPAEVKAWQAKLDEAAQADVKPNRAARRAKPKPPVA